MRKHRTLSFAAFTLIACGPNSDSQLAEKNAHPAEDKLQEEVMSKERCSEEGMYCFTFDEDLKDWQADYAEYAAVDEPDIVVSHDMVAFPNAQGLAVQSLHLHAHNPSSDQPGLFAYLRKQVQLKPNTTYRLWFFANGTFSAGDACNTQVTVKAGASEIKPISVVDANYQMITNFDNNAASPDAKTTILGQYGESCWQSIPGHKGGQAAGNFASLNSAGAHGRLLTTDAEGNLWVIIGFENRTAEPFDIYLRHLMFRMIESSEQPGGEQGSEELHFTYDFNAGEQGWQSLFADYPEGKETFYELEAGSRMQPVEINPVGKAFLLKGNNHSDDLLMLLTKKLTEADGIKAGKTYRLTYEIEFLSNAPAACMGVGGAEGESVILKAGGSDVEPATYLDKQGLHRLNIDTGSQNLGGVQASKVDHIANGLDCSKLPLDYKPYVRLKKNHTHTHPVRANEAGELWLVVGTDSGFEATTVLFYTQIKVSLSPIHYSL